MSNENSSRQFKVDDLVRCVDSYGSVGALAEGELYQVTDVGSEGGVTMLSVNNRPYIWYASRFELVEGLPLIPTSVAEYIEHLELREEALEQLVSDLTKENETLIARNRTLIGRYL